MLEEFNESQFPCSSSHFESAGSALITPESQKFTESPDSIYSDKENQHGEKRKRIIPKRSWVWKYMTIHTPKGPNGEERAE